MSNRKFDSTPIKLENELLRLDIQTPGNPYRGSRFDWTGQIVQVTYMNKHSFCTTELINGQLINEKGRGLYNEFGIDQAVGYDDCPVGGKFPKIGVGLLTKDSNKPYDFFHNYEIQRYSFPYSVEKDKVQFFCEAEENKHEYSFQLEKQIQLNRNSFTINYTLRNKGSKTIRTNEYVHNFLSINNKNISSDYKLSFPFKVNPQKFNQLVDPNDILDINDESLTWKSVPTVPFFIAGLNGDYNGKGSWSLINVKENVGIKETTSFNVRKMNLWGNTHVVSPELFVNIIVPPESEYSWFRTFTVFLLE